MMVSAGGRALLPTALQGPAGRLQCTGTPLVSGGDPNHCGLFVPHV
jgi:hypothetical protein